MSAPSVRPAAAPTRHDCPVCGESRLEPFRALLRRCPQCGLVVNPDVWRGGAEAELEKRFFDDGAYDATQSAWVRLFERWNNARTYARLARVGVTRGRLLDVGIGSGALLAEGRARGFEVEGCDLSEAIARHVRDTHGIPVHTCTLDAITGRYDAIVMNHVVEHVSDPVALLADAARLLRPGGVIHVAVPNVDSWDAALPGWTSYQPYHLVYFSPASLETAVRGAGLAPVWQGTQEPFSGWFLAALRTLAGHSPAGAVAGAAASEARPAPARRRPALVEAPYRLAMLAVGGATYPLRLLQQRLGRGEEAVLVATAASAAAPAGRRAGPRRR